MMTPSDFPDYDESLYGPSERDIKRAERKALEPPRRGSSILWKIIAFVVAVISIAAMVANIILPFIRSGSQPNQVPTRVPGRVVGVIDGTTLIVETADGRQTVRYIGVEPNVPGSPSAAYAAEVSRSMVFGKDVQLESDKVDSDGDVLLRYVLLDDTPVNLLIVAAGVARADLNGPNERYRDLFRQYQESAKAQKLGIWSGSPTFQSF